MSSLLDQQPPDHSPPAESKSILRTILPYTTAAVIIAALYVAWTFWSRYQDTKQATEAAAEKKAQAQKDVYDQISQHGELTFTTFEAADGVLKPGQTTQLCYGVVNAKTVKLDPPVENIKPSFRHCLDISPKHTTTYTITADDGAGHTKTASLTVRVK
ncbi:MAG TPA: hypothetical protein VH351_19485 [Bryobacteraceae bacterium]|jgi:hypothetical protein|nr:hypothetical protein [Bryobacteraceae bacterium]